jgi:hypothetical protein
MPYIANVYTRSFKGYHILIKISTKETNLDFRNLV